MANTAAIQAQINCVTSLFRGVGLFLALFELAVFVVKLGIVLDPPEPLRVSPETTVVTGPIGEDGLPDFHAALLARMKPEGVSPTNNGAVLFWQAVGPGAIESVEHRRLLFDEIGCPIPSEEGVLEDLHSSQVNNEIVSWIDRNGDAPRDADDSLVKATDAYLKELICRPCDCRQAPVVDRWLARNNESLDLLSEAIRRPYFYSPSPSLLENPSRHLVDMLLPVALESRRVMKCLALRAIRRAERGEQRLALRDLDSFRQYVEMCMNDGQLVQYLLGVQSNYTFLRATAAIVSGKNDPDDAKEMLAELISSHEPPRLSESGRQFETLMGVDVILRRILKNEIYPGDDFPEDLPMGIVIDVNVCLSWYIDWMNRYLAPLEIEDRQERRRQCSKARERFDILGDCYSTPLKCLAFFLSEHQRSVVVAKTYALLCAPAVDAICVAEDSACALHRLTLLTAALKLHQLQHGAYPETLDPLADGPLEEIPLDPLSNQPFFYERRDDGFVIWSVGINGVDDGANDREGDFIDGEHAPIDWTGERPKPNGPDDIVVRLPIPPLELPGAAVAD